MNKTTAKKYLSSINAMKKKWVSCENLSRHMAIYPEIIAKDLSYFEPMIMMDLSYNLKDLVPSIENYIAAEEAKSVKKPRVVANKKEVIKYKTIAEFIYEKFTVGGLVARNVELNEQDLKTLRKLVQNELSKKSKKKK